MALADKITDAPRRRTGLPCSVGALMDTLEADDLAALEKMLYELGWSGSKIYDVLASEGHIVGKQTINRHRSQACGCYR